MTTTTDQIEQLYVTYFGRPADVGGLQFWTQALTARPDILPAISRDFAQASEYQDLYGGMTTAGRISYAYENMFGREPDQAGSAFWAKALDGGAIDFAGMVQAIAAGAQGSDRMALDSKVAAAGAASAAILAGGASSVLVADLAVENLRVWLGSIDDSATLAAATTADAMGLPFKGVLYAGMSAPPPGYVPPWTTSVADLFMSELDRLPSAADYEHWQMMARSRPTEWLDQHMGRMEAFHDMNDAVPAETYVNNMYLRLFVHAPALQDLTHWTDALNAGLARSDLPARILAAAPADDVAMHSARVKLGATLLDYELFHGGIHAYDSPAQLTAAHFWLDLAADLAAIEVMTQPEAIAAEAQALRGAAVTPVTVVGVPDWVHAG